MKPLLRSLAFALLASVSLSAKESRTVELYRWVDFAIQAPGAASGFAKWDLKGTCEWTHQDAPSRRSSLLWYSGAGDTYVYRFGAPLPGRWTGRTRSPIAAFDGLEFEVIVGPSTNPNRIGWSGQIAADPGA